MRDSKVPLGGAMHPRSVAMPSHREAGGSLVDESRAFRSGALGFSLGDLRADKVRGKRNR